MAESAKFTIGGREIDVPALAFADLEDLKPDIDLLGPQLTMLDYANCVLRIIAHQLVADEDKRKSDVLAAKLEELKRPSNGNKPLSTPEALTIAIPMNELLRVSGFLMTGEAEATTESLGTGTSTSSSPNLLPTESSPETSTQ